MTLTLIGSPPERSYGWTPLHQAVLTGVSKADITRLIQDYGALRRTLSCSFHPESPYSLHKTLQYRN